MKDEVNYCFQFQHEGTTPDVAIPVSATIPKNQSKVPKPSLSQAIEKQQTRMRKLDS